MNEETVLAGLRTEIRYSGETLAWAGLLPSEEGDSDSSHLGAWVADESAFLGEFRGSYERLVVGFAEPAFRDYFAALGLDEPDLVKVRVTDSFPGSWIVEATIAIATTTGVAYKILKELSGFPAMVDGLSRLRQESLRPQIEAGIEAEASQHLRATAERAGLPSPPPHPVDVSLSLDTRPLQSLRPEPPVRREIHLAVAVTDDTVSIENLGEETLEGLRIGLFAGNEPRHSWGLDDAYRASVPSLGGKQTIARAAADFRNDKGEAPDLANAAFVECWVQDTEGIHLLQFIRDSSSIPARTLSGH
jgi:hypothetical protein